jgi:hypothetical protein
MLTHRPFIFGIEKWSFTRYTAYKYQEKRRVAYNRPATKYQKENQHYRYLYQHKNLRYVRNTQAGTSVAKQAAAKRRSVFGVEPTGQHPLY